MISRLPVAFRKDRGMEGVKYALIGIGFAVLALAAKGEAALGVALLAGAATSSLLLALFTKGTAQGNGCL